jgi:hypothetical protein
MATALTESPQASSAPPVVAISGPVYVHIMQELQRPLTWLDAMQHCEHAIAEDGPCVIPECFQLMRGMQGKQ